LRLCHSSINFGSKQVVDRRAPSRVAIATMPLGEFDSLMKNADPILPASSIKRYSAAIVEHLPSLGKSFGPRIQYDRLNRRTHRTLFRESDRPRLGLRWPNDSNSVPSNCSTRFVIAARQPLDAPGNRAIGHIVQWTLPILPPCVVVVGRASRVGEPGTRTVTTLPISVTPVVIRSGRR